jgi:hypothetical protein
MRQTPVFCSRQTSTSDIERHRHKIADVEELNVAALFDYLSGDLMA